MFKQSALLIACALLLLSLAVAQDDDAWAREGQKMGDELIRFLPNATTQGMTVDPYPPFSAFANETYVYKGADSMVHRYPSYIVHQTWWIDDAELSRQMADLEKEKAALKQEMETAGGDFFRLHGTELKAFEKDHLAESEALSKQAADLAQQGKYDDAQAVLKKMEKLPAVYPPYQALTDSLNKQQEALTDRERTLTSHRRNISFQIHTNRTPATTAPAFNPKSAGTLAGHPLYRQERGIGNRDSTLVDLAVYVGPPGYENPRVKIGHRELTVKCIVVWAWIASHSDTIKADEAAARKVLESIDYNGLAKLIEP
jgi:hypothetical protein